MACACSLASIAFLLASLGLLTSYHPPFKLFITLFYTKELSTVSKTRAEENISLFSVYSENLIIVLKNFKDQPLFQIDSLIEKYCNYVRSDKWHKRFKIYIYQRLSFIFFFLEKIF